MHKICLAPVLSATFSRDSCWIISYSWLSAGSQRLLSLADLLLGLFEDLDHTPTLGGGQRPGLHDEDAVADPTLVGLVVRLELARAAQDLAVQGVLDAVLDGHDHGLVHLVAEHQALTNLARVALGRLRRLLCCLVTHAAPSSLLSSLTCAVIPSSRSRMIV